MDAFDLTGLVAPPGVVAGRPQEGDASDDSRSPRILFVCTGNVCRSPMAELLLRAALGDAPFDVRSAGTRAPIDAPMDPVSQQIALREGARAHEVRAHRAAWLSEHDAAGADLVLALAREHRTAVVESAPSALRRTFTVREFARLSTGVEASALQHAAAGDTARERLSRVIELIAGQRGVRAPVPASEDDVIDPHRLDRDVYEASTAQLLPAIDEVARVLRAVAV